MVRLPLLDAHAREAGLSSNALAQRLLDESLRLARHPSIRFREGDGGIRFLALVGPRLSVWDVMGTVRAEGGDVAGAPAYFEISPREGEACVDYYAEFKDEVDAYGAETADDALVDQTRWLTPVE